MHQGDGKFNSSFQLNSIQGSGSIGPIFSEELAGVNSAETRRQGVIELFVCAYVVVKDSVTIPNQNKFFYVTLLYSQIKQMCQHLKQELKIQFFLQRLKKTQTSIANLISNNAEAIDSIANTEPQIKGGRGAPAPHHFLEQKFFST